MAGLVGLAGFARGGMANASVEVMRELDTFVEGLPFLDPVIAYEMTDYGWRGLTETGEVLEVRGSNGHALTVPSEIIVAHNGAAIGRRAVSNSNVNIEDYLARGNRVVTLFKDNRLMEALQESDTITPTLRAKYNRAMILLALGRWNEGFKDFLECEKHAPFIRPQVRAALDCGLRPWQGEDISGKKLLLLHAHGFGDTLMTLRYVWRLWEMGANVRLDVPDELRRLAKQFAPLYGDGEHAADYFCPMLHLVYWMGDLPETINDAAYPRILDATLVMRWGSRLGCAQRRRIGIAWSVGVPHHTDYPREIPLAELVAAFPDAELHSVQAQNGDEARKHGVQVHRFEDFADCAAFMMQMDMIVSVDTAALHLAGALHHPRVYGLLSHWASWRWIAPWYENVTLCRQAKPDDWASALRQVLQ
jgi:hypothetical protein